MNDDALLEGAVALLRDEPPPLDDEGVRSLVRAVLERASDEQLTDAMADVIRDDAPPPGGDAALLARRAASAAGEAAAVEAETGDMTSNAATPATAPRAPAPMSWVWPIAAVAVVALGVGLGFQLFSSDPTPISREPIVHRLSGGHVITATADARLEVDDDGERVRVNLEHGEALFEVEPGSDFAVRAGADLVRVTGTIFTVSNLEGSVGVRVYEGSVRIEGERRTLLGAGEAWRPVSVDVALRTEAARALRRRDRQAALPPPEAPDSVPEARAPLDETTPAGDETESTAEELPTAQSPRTGSDDETALDVAMRALAERRYEDALLLAERATGRGTTFEWEMVRGDAHRGLGRHARAAEVYRGAMRSGNRNQRAVAGLSGARVLFTSLSRAAEARRLLDESGALEPGSPVRLAARQLDAQLGPR